MKHTLLSLFLILGVFLSACNTGDNEPDVPSGGGDTGGDTDLSAQSYDMGPQAYLNVAEDAEVTFEERTDGNTDVTIDFGGEIGSAFAQHPAHIHMNDVAEGGDIAITLEPVDDATGTSTTVVTKFDDEEGETGAAVTYQDLVAYDGYVNVHLSAENIDVVFASANIGANADVALPEAPSLADLVTSQANAESGQEFTILLQALTAAELGTLLGDAAAGPFTVLAPTDAAFEALIEESDDLNSAADLLALPNLADILNYHVLPSPVVRSDVVTAATAEGGTEVETAQGSSLTLSANAEGNVLIDEAVAISGSEEEVTQKTNLATSNGVAHIIETVLMPSEAPTDAAAQ